MSPRRLAQCDVGQPAIHADVAHGGEASMKHHSRRLCGLEDRRSLAVLERFGRVVAGNRPVGNVGVEINQAREDGEVGPVDRGAATGAGRPRRDRHDAAVNNSNQLVGEDFAGGRIAGLFETLPLPQLFGAVFMTTGISAAVLLFLIKPIRNLMGGVH